MAEKRKLDSHVVDEEEVEMEEEEQTTSDSSEGEDGEDDDGGDDVEEESEGDEEECEDEEEESEGDEEESGGDKNKRKLQVGAVEEDFSSKESIVKLLEPFGKGQLIEIFKEAALRDSSFLYRIVNEADTADRKVYAHGLGPDVTHKILYDAFAPFGKVADCMLIVRPKRRHGFILFRYPAAAQRALKEPQKKIGTDIATCSLAGPSTTFNQARMLSETTERQVYVKKIRNYVKPDRLLAFFSRFGEIEFGPIGCNARKKKFRGNAVFVYKTVEGCNKALEEPSKYFQGCLLQCERAMKASGNNNNAQMEPVVAAKTLPTSNIVRSSATSSMGHNSRTGTTTGQSGRDRLFNPAEGFLSANRGSGMVLNRISPCVIAKYSSLAALQGLGAYQSAPAAAIWPQSGSGSIGAGGFPPSFG